MCLMKKCLPRQDDIRTFCLEHYGEMEMIRGWLRELEAA
jgi:hypothetical protein